LGDSVPDELIELPLDVLAVLVRGDRAGDDQDVPVKAGLHVVPMDRVWLIDLSGEDRRPPASDLLVQQACVIDLLHRTGPVSAKDDERMCLGTVGLDCSSCSSSARLPAGWPSR